MAKTKRKKSSPSSTQQKGLPATRSPFERLGGDDLDAGYLKLCAEWHVARAQQRLHWAQGDLESAWDSHPSLDLSALQRMKNIEIALKDWKPCSMIGVKQLVEICLTIQVYAEVESPEDNFGQGPVIDYLKNIRDALANAPDEQRMAP
jgi:hypothetical protein